MRVSKIRTLQERFFEKIRKTSTCWLWQGSLNKKGYGQLNRGRRGEGVVLAHRASWEIHNGAIPDGLCVLHKCDNPQCVNPDHLFLGTIVDNDKDRDAKGRTRKGDAHKFAKLRATQIPEIRRRIATGEKHESIAADYGVSAGVISQVGRRKIWKHVSDPSTEFPGQPQDSTGELVVMQAMQELGV
jgi:hypothetical protein